MATAAVDSTSTPIDAENLAIDATVVNWEESHGFAWLATDHPR